MLKIIIWPALGHDWLEDTLIGSIRSRSIFRVIRIPSISSTLAWQCHLTHRSIDPITFLKISLPTRAELAVAHKLAVLMRQTSLIHPDWHLPQLTNELVAISKNERRFLGFQRHRYGL